MSQVSKFKFKFKFIKNALEFNIYENYIKLGFKTVFQPAKIAADSREKSLWKIL